MYMYMYMYMYVCIYIYVYIYIYIYCFFLWHRCSRRRTSLENAHLDELLAHCSSTFSFIARALARRRLQLLLVRRDLDLGDGRLVAVHLQLLPSTACSAQCLHPWT